MAERTVTDEQLDILVEQRMAERRKVAEEVVAILEPKLEGIWREAATANHVKRTLGRQLTNLERLVKQTNAELGKHVILSAHPGTADVIDRMEEALDKGEQLTEQFGVEDLSLEQKQALPGILREYVTDQVDRQKGDRRSSRRAGMYQLVATIVASVAGAVVAVAAILSLVANGTVQVGVHHP
jgi:hypothetical protein